MSRIGNQPVTVPNGVTVEVSNKTVLVKGPKGELSQGLPVGISVTVADNEVVIKASNTEKQTKSNHGLIRSLINNMVVGVSQGYEKKLEVNGVGFKVALAGNKLSLALGYSHGIEFSAPEGVNLAVESNVITVSGPSKQQVGQVAADIRSLRKPEPYKGKGIKYQDEVILRKTGKSAAGGATSA